MFTGAKMGEWGWIGNPRGKDNTYQYDENYMCPHGCLVGWPFEENGSNELPEMEWWVVLQELMSDVGQLVFVQVPVEGWVIDADKHGLLDGPCDVVCLPA